MHIKFLLLYLLLDTGTGLLVDPDSEFGSGSINPPNPLSLDPIRIHTSGLK
jgi:hypothetical protein